MKTAILMDPIENIHPEKDTSFALLLAAQKKQWPIYYFEIKDLFLQNRTAYAFAKKLQVKDNKQTWFIADTPTALPLTYFDLIFMRKDPPVDQAYLHATQILDFAEQAGTRIINKPSSLRDYNEKLAIQYFPHLCPETLVSANCKQISEFINEHKEVICKPLDGMGGQGIFKISASDSMLMKHLIQATHQEQTQIMCQRY